MMLPLPKRAFISFITASSALACSGGNLAWGLWCRLVQEVVVFCYQNIADFRQSIFTSMADLLGCCVILCPCIAGGFPGICFQCGCASAGIPIAEVCS